jgi:CBS domain containing-hemolysin-like protein
MPSSSLKHKETAHFSSSDAEENQPAKKSPLRLFAHWLRSGLHKRNGDTSIKETLEEMLEESDEGTPSLTHEERDLLKNMLAFGEVTVHDVMVPRADIAAVESTVTMNELKQHITQQSHTRVPVYEETLDNVKGFIHVKDLLPMLSGDKPYNLQSVLREILFVSPSMRLLDLLRKMRLSGSHMAVVVDEYGGTDGLATMENVFEEIVGDIRDEHDAEERLKKSFVWSTAGICDMDARAPIEKVEQDLGIELRPHHEDEDFDTIGGLIFIHAKRVPGKGETITHPSGAKFEILEADPRRIHRVRIHRPSSQKLQDVRTA